MRKVLFIVTSILILAATPTGQGTNPPTVIHPALVAAIVQVESSGNPRAVSKRGAYGLMQIRHKVWSKGLKEAGIIRDKRDLFDPEINVKAGTFILGYYLKRHNGDIEAALTAYSGGAKGYADKVKREGGF